MPVSTLVPMTDYALPPMASKNVLPEHFYLDSGQRQRTPGYSEYATGAINDLAPTPLDAASYAPFIGEAADAASLFKDLQSGKYGDAGMSLLGMALPFVGAGVIKRIGADPDKIVPAYRAHRVFDRGSKKYGHLYPAMIGKDTPMETALSQQIPMNEWLKSELIPFTMAERQGWHAGALPYGEQFNVARNGGRSKADKIYQPDDVVYTQVDLGAEQDFSNILGPGPERIYGVKDKLPFDQTQLPEGGLYKYQNPSTPYPWLVGDYVRHNRILTDEEIADIYRQAGLEPPPPRRSGRPINEARLRELGLL